MNVTVFNYFLPLIMKLLAKKCAIEAVFILFTNFQVNIKKIKYSGMCPKIFSIFHNKWSLNLNLTYIENI
jgi:hypothetical protein